MNNDISSRASSVNLDAIERQMQQDQEAMTALIRTYAPKLKVPTKIEKEEELGAIFTLKGLFTALVTEPIDKFAYQQEVLATNELHSEYTSRYVEYTSAQKKLTDLYAKTTTLVNVLKTELSESRNDASFVSRIRIHQKELLDLRWQILATKCDLFVAIKNYIHDYPQEYTAEQGRQLRDSFKSIMNEFKEVARICEDPLLQDATFIKTFEANLDGVADGFKKLCELYHNKADLEISLDFAQSNVVDSVVTLGRASLRRTAETPKEQRIIAIQMNLAKVRSQILTEEDDLIKTFAHSLIDRTEKMHMATLLQTHHERIRMADREWKQLEESSLHAKNIAESEHLWKEKKWGQLILAKDNNLSKTIYDFNRGIKALEEQIEASSSNDQRRDHEKAKKKYEVARNQVILQKIVEVIGDKQHFIKMHSGDAAAILSAQQDLYFLNEAFKDYFEKYTLQYVALPDVSLQEYVLEPLNKLNPWSLGRPLPPQKILTDKRYADVGYKMWEDGKAWFDSLTFKQGETLDQKLKTEIKSFLRWADEHPRAAAELASDMAQVCAILQDKDLITQFQNSLQAKVYVSAVLGELGREAMEPVESPQHLHFRALADFCHFLPTHVAAGKAVVKVAFSRNQGWLERAWNVGTEVVSAAVVQNAISIIPPTNQETVLAVAGILQGEPMYNVLEQQKNIQLLKLAGDVRRAITNPEAGIPQRVVKNWWKSIWSPKSFTEKTLRVLTQLVVPFVGVATITTIAAVLTPVGAPLSFAIFGNLVNPFILFSTFMFAIPFAMLYMKFTGGVLDSFYPSTVKDIEEAEIREKMKNYQRQLQSRAKEYIKWVKRNILPNLVDPKTIRVNNPKLSSWVDRKPESALVAAFEEALNAGLETIRGEENIPAPHSGTYVKAFIEKASYKKVQEHVKHLMIEEWILKKDRDIRQVEPWLLAGVTLEGQHDELVEKILRSEFFTTPDIAATLEKITLQILQQLEQKWLAPGVQNGYENEFIAQCLAVKEEIAVEDVDPKESMKAEVAKLPPTNTPQIKEIAGIIIEGHLNLAALGAGDDHPALLMPRIARTA